MCHSTSFTSNFLSCPQNFHSHSTNAVFEDVDHTGFGTVDAHMDYFECENQLNALEAALKFTNPQSMWNYVVHGIDFVDVPFDAVNALWRAIGNVANDFSTGSQNSFDPSRPCTVCGAADHNFSNCPGLEDNKKVKQAYICLWVALNHFLPLIEKINNNHNDLSCYQQ